MIKPKKKTTHTHKVEGIALDQEFDLVTAGIVQELEAAKSQAVQGFFIHTGKIGDPERLKLSYFVLFW